MCHHSDTYVGAIIELRFREKHRASSDRVVNIQYTVLDDMNRPAVNERVGAFPSSRSAIGFSSKGSASNNTMEVTVTFPNLNTVSGDMGL